MKKLFAPLFTALLCCAGAAVAQPKQIAVNSDQIFGGYIATRVALTSYAVPVVHISNASYQPVAALPANAAAAGVTEAKVMIGMERKQPFAVVQVPAYTRDAGGHVQQLRSFTLDVTESGTPAPAATAAKGTAANAVLAAGTWYKIAVPARGLYKVDYSFLSAKLGLGAVSSANIRLFGNGGQMLSENNRVPRAADLTENAILMNDGGDGTFNGSDYFVFYATGPMAWDKDSVNMTFTQRKNLYADSSYYFITVDQGAGLRISTQQATGTANKTVIDFDEYIAHEEDLYNPGKFGKVWLGEDFGNVTLRGNSADFTFNTGTATGPIAVRMALADRSSADGSIFTATVNGQSVTTPPFRHVSLADDDTPYMLRKLSFAANANGPTTTVRLNYSPAINDGVGYLDYIVLNYRRALSFANALNFRDWSSVGAGNIASYQIEGANGNTQVWDVTDPLVPVRMSGSLAGTRYTFTREATRLHEFVMMDGSQYSTPYYIGKVENQNIHGAASPSLIIVTAPAFLPAANKLADMHRTKDHMDVLVVTTPQIYNEFSSGGQDVSAIRDMVRMFYQRAGSDTSQMPRNLLLLGDASYDYKNRVPGNTNYVPTFESGESQNVGYSYVVDEFYGMLDDNEDIENTGIANTLDIGIGRLPVKTPDEAVAIVDKIIAYRSPASLGPWRLNATYLADNEDDAGAHLTQAEEMKGLVDDKTHDLYNNTKIYLDNFPFVSTPGGIRCPDGNKAINDDIFKGTFMINFTGHGSIYTLTHERVLTADDFSQWKNINKLPFMITATCDFSRYDHPEYVSAGEKLIVKPDGGAVAMLTTTAAVYAPINKSINTQFLNAQFDQHQNGAWYTFGEAFRRGKNETYMHVPDLSTLINNRAFILLADPALQPAFPKHFIHTDSLMDATTGLHTDSLKALGSYSLSGTVTDVAGQTLGDFNGRAYVTIYDKPRNVTVTTHEIPPYFPSYNVNFQMQDNVIYKGIATVTNGHFNFRFIAPKDLNYDFGRGRISYYAENGDVDAAGLDTNMTIGGFSDHPVTDNEGPVVRPFMNDSLFRDGAVTGANTLLYVKLYDEIGINASGNGVGHDITAVLDDNESVPYIMNDYYQAEPNTYQRGTVSFPVTGLANGRHRFTVKAWDVNNSSGEGTVNFVVSDGKVVDVQNLMNYPNPFSNITHFVFEHNHPNETYKVQILISSTDGRIIRVLDQSFTPSGSHSNELTWDGTDQHGAKVPNGIYPYKMILTTEKGIQATAYQKLVFIR